MTYVLILLGVLVPRCEFVAVTYDGNEYVVGSGDTCAEAVDGWVVLDGWRMIERRQRYVWAGSR